MSEDPDKPDWHYLIYLATHPAVIILVLIVLIGIIATCTIGPRP